MEDFIREEIYFRLANNEDYENLTIADHENIMEHTIDDIINDNELNECLTQTIEWYINKYIGSERFTSERDNVDYDLEIADIEHEKHILGE